ncbi:MULTISPECIES: Hint domain-containing protein [Asaia]|uniref:Hint domain-containing protein n=1 Tax=Asaia TaxID=91914 RepID=UPI002FC27C65
MTQSNDAYKNAAAAASVTLRKDALTGWPVTTNKVDIYKGTTWLWGGPEYASTISAGYTCVVHSGGNFHDALVQGAVLYTEAGAGLNGNITIDGNSRLEAEGGSIANGATVTLQGYATISGSITNNGIISAGYANLSGNIKNNGTIIGAKIYSNLGVNLSADLDNTNGVIKGTFINHGSLTGGTLTSSYLYNSGSIHGAVTVDGLSTINGGTISDDSVVTVQGFGNLIGSVTNNGTISAGYGNINGPIINNGVINGTPYAPSPENMLSITNTISNTSGYVTGTFKVSGGAASIEGGHISGTASVQAGAHLRNLTADAGSVINLNRAGVATNVINAATASGYVSAGAAVYASGGTASNWQVLSGGTASGMSGGVLSAITAVAGGAVVLSPTAKGAGVTIESGGSLYVSSGASIENSTIENKGYASIISGATAVNMNVEAGGSGYIYDGATAIASAGLTTGLDVWSGGTAIAETGGTLSQIRVRSSGEASVMDGGIIENSQIYSGGTVYLGENASISGTLGLQQGASASLYNNAGGTVVISGNTDTSLTLLGLSSGNSATTEIRGFGGTAPGNSDVLKIPGISISDIQSVSYPDDDHVTLTLTDGSEISLHIIGIKSVGYALGSADDGSLTYEVCFLAGTLIRTPNGEIPVEDLRAGDIVLAKHAETEATYQEIVTWSGRRQVCAQKNTAYPDRSGFPVRVKEGAISDGIPSRDLLITPEHCLYLEERFIPVRLLINGKTIFYDETISQYTYYHIETSAHSIIWAEGAETESYLDTGNRAKFPFFATKDKPVHLVKNWNTDAAAPLGTDKNIVEPIYRKLEKRASALGFMCENQSYEITCDPCIRLLLPDGRKISQARAHGNKVIFRIPPGIQHVRLQSRSDRPCDLGGSFIDDRRILGLRVGEITHFATDRTQQISIESHASASRGWYQREADDSHWTNGDAFINLDYSFFLTILSIEIKQAGPYRIKKII